MYTKKELLDKSEKFLIFSKEVAKLSPLEIATRSVFDGFYDLNSNDPKKHPIASSAELPSDLEYLHPQGSERICGLFYSKSRKKHYCSSDFQCKVGDVLWVSEPIYATELDINNNKLYLRYISDGKKVAIELSESFLEKIDIQEVQKWLKTNKGFVKNNIKEIARSFYVVVNTRVERLQDITFNDMIKEGYNDENFKKYIKRTKRCNVKLKDWVGITNELLAKQWFIDTWDSIHKNSGNSWESNPYVLVSTYKKIVEYEDGDKNECN